MKDKQVNNHKKIIVIFIILAFLLLLIFFFFSSFKNDSTKDEETVVETVEEIVNKRGLACFLKKEYIHNIDGKKPVPSDFFCINKMDSNKGLTENEVNELHFEKALTEEELKKPGKYKINILYYDQVLEGHLNVVDTTPPVFTVPDKLTYAIGDKILYKKGVSVKDNSGEEIEIKLNILDVVSNKPGIYTVEYSACDSSGNVGRATTEIEIVREHIPTVEEVDELADEVLNKIIQADMSSLEQIRAIFDWCSKYIYYSVDAEKDNILIGAYDGLHYKRGDCYTFFATSTYLFNRVGIENLPVTKKGDDYTHYWSLINIGDGWYHFDAMIYMDGFKCFMQTDEQVRNHAEKAGLGADYFCFDEENMPDRAKKIIFENKNIRP